jgi:HlyD family type I secretion membrane fusion protein
LVASYLKTSSKFLTMFTNSTSQAFYFHHNEDLIPPVSPLITLGGLSLVTMFGVGLGLTSLINYNVTVKTPSTVRPAGETRIAQTAIAGRVQQILVKPNQTVKQGDAIAIMDDFELKRQQNQLQDNIQQNQRQLLNTQQQIRQIERQINYENLIGDRNVEVARHNYQATLREYQDREVIAIANLQEAESALSYAQEEFKRYQSLTKVGAISLQQAKEKEQAVITNYARLKKARAEQNPSAAEAMIALENIKRERQRSLANLAVLVQEKQQLINNRIELGKQIYQAQQELEQLKAQVQKTVIRSPITGTILELKVRNPGQVIASGDIIAQISPQNTPLVVKSQVGVDDISKVTICRESVIAHCQQGKVQMKVSAYPFTDYGVLPGAVRSISADTLNTESNSTPYYEVTIEPERSQMTRDGKLYPIQPGMSVSSSIIAQEDTLMKFLLRKTRLIADM